MTHFANHAIFALFGQTVVRAWRVFNNRRQFTELKHWSDEQLKDIGLTRSDVRRALALPFYADPTTLLSSSSAVHRSPTLHAANTPALTLQDEHGKLAA
jgi:uncharacterized protein YjiS (DUF1127 family)